MFFSSLSENHLSIRNILELIRGSTVLPVCLKCIFFFGIRLTSVFLCKWSEAMYLTREYLRRSG